MFFVFLEELLEELEAHIKGTVHPKIKNTCFFLLPVVVFIRIDSFGVSCLVLEISVVEISAFSLI